MAAPSKSISALGKYLERSEVALEVFQEKTTILSGEKMEKTQSLTP